VDSNGIWKDFYYCKNAVNEDSTALEHNDLKILLDYIEQFLRYVDSKNEGWLRGAVR
jgi:hypothetical protein